MLAVATASSVQRIANTPIFGHSNGTGELQKILARKIGAQSIPLWRGSLHYSCKASSSDENGGTDVFTASISGHAIQEPSNNGNSLVHHSFIFSWSSALK